MAIQNSNLPQLKNMLNAPSVKAKFEEMLGKRAPQFLTSITSVVSNNALLQKADASSIVMGAAIAASMDLPLNPNLGYAALVPFNSKDGCFAQFQIMVKGWTDLFLRSGQCQSLINEVVYEGQLVSKNKFTGDYVFDEGAKVSDKIIGVMAYFRLTNGFEKTEYMTIEEVKAHAQKFSQSYRRGAGIWKENFEAMALKGLSIDTPIKTYNKGWVKMGDIEKGDVLFDGEGRLTQVIAVSERKNIPCYKITFLNGQEIICDEEHDFVIRTKNRKQYTMNIKDMFELKSKYNDEHISIDTTTQGGFNVELPIDPYCLGYWLGNGNCANSSITTHSKDTDFVKDKFIEAGYDVNVSKNSENSDTLNISRRDKSVRTGGFKEKLRNEGLLGNKHIPEIYELAGFDQRLELVRGLMDSDGCCSIRPNGTVRASFSQVAEKKHIVDSLYRILCSIGEQPSMPKKIRGNGFGKYVESYQIQFTPVNNVFSTPRKSIKHRNRILRNSWAIASIEKISPVETVCIAVDSPSKTYLCTESQIKTHNTCLKRLLTKWAPKSLEMNMLQTFDQSVVKGDIHHLEEAEAQYMDRNVEQTDNEENAYTDVEDVTIETDSVAKETASNNNVDGEKEKDELEF